MNLLIGLSTKSRASSTSSISRRRLTYRGSSNDYTAVVITTHVDPSFSPLLGPQRVNVDAHNAIAAPRTTSPQTRFSTLANAFCMSAKCSLETPINPLP